MDKVQFKVGDRVLVKRAFEGNDEVIGTCGTVVWVDTMRDRVDVEHDVESLIMHDCIGAVANHHGWSYINPERYLELLPVEPDVSEISLGDFL